MVAVEEAGTEVSTEDSCLLELVTATATGAVGSAEDAVMKTPPGGWEAEAKVGAGARADVEVD